MCILPIKAFSPFIRYMQLIESSKNTDKAEDEDEDDGCRVWIYAHAETACSLYFQKRKKRKKKKRGKKERRKYKSSNIYTPQVFQLNQILSVKTYRDICFQNLGSIHLLGQNSLLASRVVIFHYTVTYRQYGFTSVHDKRTSQWPLPFILMATDTEVTARLTLNGLDDEIMQEPQNEGRLCWAADQLGLYQGGEFDCCGRAQLDTHTTPQVGSDQRLSMLSLISFPLA